MGESVLFALVSELLRLLGASLIEAKALEANLVGHAGVEVLLHVSEGDAIVGALGARERGFDGAEVKVHDVTREIGVGLARGEHALSTEVLLDGLNGILVAAGEVEVLNGVLINREVSHSGTVFRSHVGNGGTISQRDVLDTRAEELDELADDTALSEHIDAGQDKIGGSGTLRKVTGELETDDFRKDHGDGLTQHHGFSLNTANTPTGNTETVNHGGVRISANNGVRVEQVVALHNNAGEVLKVNLMDDTRAWGHDAEVVEGLGAPLEELEALTVTVEFHLLVELSGIERASLVDLNRMINDEIDGAQGVDLLGVATDALHAVSHGSQVDNSGDTTTIMIKIL